MYDDDDEMNGSDWEDGSIPTLNNTNDNDRDNVNRSVTIEFDASPSDSAKRKPVRRASVEEKVISVMQDYSYICIFGCMIFV